MTYKTICYFISLVWFWGTENWIQSSWVLVRCSAMELCYPVITSHKMPEAVKSQIPQFLTWNIRKTVMLQVCSHLWLSWCLGGSSNSILLTQWYQHKLHLESKCTNCKGLIAAQISRVEHQQLLKQPTVVHRAQQTGATHSSLIPG